MSEELQENTKPEVVTIEVTNPSTEEMAEICNSIQSQFPSSVEVQSTEFKFKKSVNKDTNTETIRNAVNLAIPYPNLDGLITILENGGKGLELLNDLVAERIDLAARTILYTDTTLNVANFPVEQLAWEHIANLPKAQRRGIAKELWEGFVKDYCAVMPEATGKTETAVANAAKIFKNKLAQVKSHKQVLSILAGQLTIYAEASENVAEYADVVSFLSDKIELYLSAEDEDVLDSL